VTRLVDQVVDRLRAEALVDPSTLALRVDALSRFRRAAEPYLPADWLEPARAVAARAGQRLARSRTHTVVALAGGTGSGKSSLFNALAGEELSPVGVRRPTTGAAYACVWGAPDEARVMLDWLRIPPANRFARDGAPGRAGPLGLVLVDLPDFDSIEPDHATEVERLLELVDVVVWVVDPQKYADRVLHARYLRRFRQHRDVTLVVLNQVDLLADGDVPRVLADLDQLLIADGLAGAPTIATSAVVGLDGVAGLRAFLQRAVTTRRAALLRLAADVNEVISGLADLVGPAVPELTIDRTPELVGGLAEAAGAAGVTRAAEAAYRARANAAMSGPLPRWLRRLRPAPPPAPAVPEPVGRAAAQLAVRGFASRAAARLPPPWPDAVADAARSHLDELPGALAAAVATATNRWHQGASPWWWRLVSLAQWAATGLVVAGLGWALAGWLLRMVALPLHPPRVGALPLPGGLVLAGLVSGLGLLVLARWLARWSARRARARVAGRLRAALAEVGQVQVVEPVRVVLRGYEEARAALAAAGSG
jgi:hypothetical protein